MGTCRRTYGGHGIVATDPRGMVAASWGYNNDSKKGGACVWGKKETGNDSGCESNRFGSRRSG